jgi:two-component system chemotaxis sensor kinase CheA
MGDDMQAYREVFASESAEYVQSIIDGMLRLESDPSDLEPVETVFRGAHSLKGMAAAMGYERTADLTHKMEALMDTVRRREQRVDEELADLILRAVDVVKALIEDEMSGGSAVDPSGVTAELAALTKRGEAGVGGAAPRIVPGASGDGAEGSAAHSGGAGSGRTVLVRITLEEACVLKSVRAYMVVKRLSHMGDVLETHPSARDLEDEAFESSFDVVLKTAANADDITAAVAAVSEVAHVETEEPDPAPIPVAAEGGLEATVPAREDEAAVVKRAIPKLSETQTVRISIGHLDNMVNLVGELVIIRARLENLARGVGRPEMSEALEEFQRVSAELQHEVMQTRMVPVGNIFNRFPRMVRDLAHNLGKDIAFEMEGLDIELDRTVLDEVVDPIVHLLRNAVDHGVESPDVRQAAGKEPRGTVRLVATRERDQVQLIVADDGRGMDVERIWAKAVERGLAAADARDLYTAEEVLRIACAPGFSTVDEANAVSGRGVGMDVVRGKIEYLGGSLSIRSELGRGTEFVLSLPLTLAIIQALLLDAGGQTFALPLSFVSEVFDVADIDADTIDGAPVLTLRDGRVVPLYRLDVLIGSHDDHTRSPEHGEHVLLVEIGGQARGLTVTRLLGRQEIVIKPLARMIRHTRGLGGATVLGDGSVALILDPRMLFTMGDERR